MALLVNDAARTSAWRARTRHVGTTVCQRAGRRRSPLMALVLDTGPLLAALDAADPDHAACAALLVESAEDLVDPDVGARRARLLVCRRLHPDAWLTFLDDVVEGAYVVEPPTTQDLARAGELQQAYGDLGLGVVDATVIALVERLAEGKVATLDHRHFETVLPAHVEVLRLVP